MINKLNYIYILNLIINDLFIKLMKLHWKIKYFLIIWCNKFLNYLNYKIFFKKIFFFFSCQNYYFLYFQSVKLKKIAKLNILPLNKLEFNYILYNNFYYFKFLN